MGRSNGYRPKAACREEVLELRAQLAQCRGQDWAKAGMIMQHIAALVGTPLGPMNGRVMPRACKFCDHYGHTRQWCKVREAALKAQEEREIYISHCYTCAVQHVSDTASASATSVEKR